jgi:hypothetical protein
MATSTTARAKPGMRRAAQAGLPLISRSHTLNGDVRHPPTHNRSEKRALRANQSLPPSNSYYRLSNLRGFEFDSPALRVNHEVIPKELKATKGSSAVIKHLSRAVDHAINDEGGLPFVLS